MAGIKGDFTGFYFKGVHSSALNITRVSGGDRYDLSISPSFQDQTGEVAGANKIYYFGTNEREREFEINIAFDSLSEANLRTLAGTFAPAEIGALIFDELPYKVYYAKLKDAPKFSVLTFMNKNGAREYKGEATLNFVCYDPQAYSRFKFLDQYNMSNIPIWSTNEGNKSEWDTSSRLLSTQSTIDKWFYNINSVTVYNPGDKEAPFRVYVQGVYNGSTNKYNYDFKLAITGDSARQLIIVGASDSPIICVDMAAHLTIGCGTGAATYAVNADGVYYKNGSNYLLRVTGAEAAPFYNIVTSSLVRNIAEDLFYAGNYFLIPKCAATNITKTLTIAGGVGTLKGKIVGLEYNYIFY